MITLVDMSVRVLIVFLDFNLVYVFLKRMSINYTKKKKKKKRKRNNKKNTKPKFKVKAVR